MELLRKYLKESIEKMERDRVRLHILGDTSALAPDILDLIAKADEIAARIDGTQFNICLNYGGRTEILHAAAELARMCAAGELALEDINETIFGEHLYSKGIPDPDLIIRPSGEKADIQLSLVAVGLLRILLYGHALAGLRQK